MTWPTMMQAAIENLEKFGRNDEKRCWANRGVHEPCRKVAVTKAGLCDECYESLRSEEIRSWMR